MKKNKYCPLTDKIHRIGIRENKPCFYCLALNRQREDMEEELRKQNSFAWIQGHDSGTWERIKECQQMLKQQSEDIYKEVLDMLEEKPGESGWSREFNERLVEKLEQSLKSRGKVANSRPLEIYEI